MYVNKKLGLTAKVASHHTVYSLYKGEEHIGYCPPILIEYDDNWQCIEDTIKLTSTYTNTTTPEYKIQINQKSNNK